MSWFVPTHRDDHPCLRPTGAELEAHRIGEMWRCEVCDDLWVVERDETVFAYSTTAKAPKKLVQVWRFYLRWRYRKEGYANADVPQREDGPA